MRLHITVFLWLEMAAVSASIPKLTPNILIGVRGRRKENEVVCEGDVCTFKPKLSAEKDDTDIKAAADNRISPAKGNFLEIRGGKTEFEVVCDGNVCELKPKKHGKKILTKKSVASTEGVDNLFAGKSSLVKKILRFFQRLFGVSPTLKCGVENAKSKRAGSVLAGKNTTAAKVPKTGSANPPAIRTAITKSPANRGRARGGSASRTSAALRIQRELLDFQKNPPPNCAVSVREDNMNVWIVTLTGVNGTLFEGEKFKLRFEFPKEYPSRPPSVYFLKPTPRHVHVYTNGDICLDLLGKGWKPQATARTLAISILSMLSSAKEKGIPPDNCNHADNAPGKPQVGWLYHDDHC